MIDDKPGQGDALGDRLAERMDVLGLSVEDLRDRMGRIVTTGSIYAWRRGERTVRHDNLRALALALDVSTDWLVGLTDDPAPRPRKSSDPAEAEARRYERAVRALAGEKRRLKARYSDEWVKSGDEGRPVSDTPGSDGESRFYSLVGGWYEDHILAIPPRQVYRYDALAEVIETPGLTCGEFRFLCGNVSPMPSASPAETTDNPRWWLDHRDALRAQLEQIRREERA